jgi:membrane protease YdiL (CAAX protease family)
MNYKPVAKYPSNFKIIFLIITIMLFTNLFGAFSIVITKELGLDIGANYIQGFSQLFVLLGLTILLTNIIPLKLNTLIRLENNIRIKHLLLGVVGLIFLNLFNNGYVSLQEYLIPEFLMPDYYEHKNWIQNLYNSMLKGDGVFDMSIAIVIGAVIPAISEELLFRGVGQRALEERNSPLFSILIVSSIFGLLHFNFINLIPLITIGIFLGALAYYSKNIIIPIFIHFLNNAFSILMMYLDTSSTEFTTVNQMGVLESLGILTLGIVGIVSTIIILSRFEN